MLCGIGLVYEDKVGCCGLCVGDFVELGGFVVKFDVFVDYYNVWFCGLGFDVYDCDVMLVMLVVFVLKILLFVCLVWVDFNDVIDCGECILFEGL